MLTLSYPLSSSFYLSWVLLLSFQASSIASPFQPNFLAFGASWFLCCWCLDCCCVFISVFWLIFLFLFVSVVLLWDYDNKCRFPCNSGFVFQKGCYYSWYRERVSGNSRDVLLVFFVFFPKALFFQNHSVCHFLLFFSSVFHFNIPCVFLINPFWNIILVLFSLALSLLPLSFLRFCFVPSNQFPAIPFSNPPCFHFRSFRSSILPFCTLLFSGLAFPSFLFLLVFVWFSCDCCCHLSFHHWEFCS